MKKFPIGLQTFSELIEENYYYIDKTPLIHRLATTGKYYFLSRPRRFGKSLLVSTLASAFRGEQELFKSLYLENNWDWSKKYPVIDISFGRGVAGSVEVLEKRFKPMLDEVAKRYSLRLEADDVVNRFAELIQGLHESCGEKVVILVDEYDKPILDNINDSEKALAMREVLKDIYSTIKDNDRHIKFVLLTGVSKFSKVGLFSGLNNLNDISLDSDYAALCGYTEQEIKDTFIEHLQDVDFDRLRTWYNGYNFMGEKVYNPFDVLLFLKSKKFKNYWFETGSPSFLLKLVKDRQYNLPDMENIYLAESNLGTFDVDNLPLETLLFQTGYLTIDSVEEVGEDTLYHLTYPNREVKASLNQHLLADLTQGQPSEITRQRFQIYKSLDVADFEAFKQSIDRLFASIPADWYRKNQLANYEGYYASIVYSCLCAQGLQVIAEDHTNHGRIDLTVMLGEKVFIMEFKALNEDDEQGAALAQIKAKNYQQKYVAPEKQVFLLGMEFDRQQRNLVFFEWERV